MLVHAGPFGNIGIGSSSVLADLIGIRGGDYLVTEAGFGADMGAERFFNIKCRASRLVPDAAVVVATVRALKASTGEYRVVAGRPLPEELLAENPDDVLGGSSNLRKQVENIRIHGVTPVVAEAAEEPSEFRFAYADEATLREKIETIATHVYGAGGVDYPICGEMQTMPGLGRRPAAFDVDLLEDGTIVGLS